jgi:NADPH-dependent glutamate synthase beta subunit-like oxidoreductase
VVGIIGGAVAGSEAAALVAEKGAIAVVFEQGARPYGKIEDGLPRWHDKLRQKEYERIDANLSREGVVFVPNTKIGDDLTLATLCKEYGLSAILLANGAWRDRPLPIDGVDEYVGRGLLYQNPFVYWFNHYHEAGYRGPRYEVVDNAIVVGGGLASVDVVKVINLELYAAALRKLGHEVDLTELEVKGIPRICEDLGVDPASLGVHGATLYYRRSMEEMPVATADNPTPEQELKLRASRVKIMERVMRKYLVHFVGNAAPAAGIVEGERLVGLRFSRTEVVDGRVRAVAGADFEVRAPLVLSSIGSVPEPMAGIPTRGELYDYADWKTGAVRERRGVFGLGNVLTGQGNIKDSRQNAAEITEHVASDFLGVGDDPDGGARGRVAIDVAPAVEAALHGRALDVEAIRKVGALVRSRHEAVGYRDYNSWMAAHRPGESG